MANPLKYRNKKAISSVIATVLIVLITISAVAIISPVIVGYVRENLYKSTECYEVKEHFSFETTLNFNCIRDNSVAVMSIRAGSGEKNLNGSATEGVQEKIKGFEIVLYDKDGSKRIAVPSAEAVMLNDSDFNHVILPNPGEARTYNLSAGARFDKAELHVSLKSGTICKEVADRVDLKTCN